MNVSRVTAIEKRLTEVFAPVKLLVKDQSHLHAGHEGAKAGGGHFHVTIVAEAFVGRQAIERHRMVFAALDTMMQSEIHALRIQALAPGEE